MFARTILNFTMTPILACVIGSAVSASRATEGADLKADPIRTAIEALAGEITTRLDNVDALRERLVNEKIAAMKATAAGENATKDAEVAEIAENEYKDNTFAQETQLAEGEIALADAELQRAKDRSESVEKMFKRGSVAEAQVLADRMTLQKCEIQLLNAKKKREVLVKYTFEKNLALLGAKAKAARARSLERKADASQANRIVDATKRTLADAELSKAETDSLISLDDAIRLFDSGQAEKARATLEQASKTWRDEQDRRARARFDEMKGRIRFLADKARAAR
jgi:hypothetical protein